MFIAQVTKALSLELIKHYQKQIMLKDIYIYIYTKSHTDTCGQTDVAKLTGASGNNENTSKIQGDRGCTSSGM